MRIIVLTVLSCLTLTHSTLAKTCDTQLSDEPRVSDIQRIFDCLNGEIEKLKNTQNRETYDLIGSPPQKRKQKLPVKITASKYELGSIPVDLSDSLIVKKSSQGYFFSAISNKAAIDFGNLALSGNFDVTLKVDYHGFQQVHEFLLNERSVKITFSEDLRGGFISFANTERGETLAGWLGGSGINDITIKFRKKQMIFFLNNKPFSAISLSQGEVLKRIKILGLKTDDRLFSLEIRGK